MKIPLIEAFDVSITSNENRVLFRDLNMVFSGEHVAIVGRNGVGKSTLLSTLCGLNPPQSGKVVLHTEPHFIVQNFDLDNLDNIWREQESIPPEKWKKECYSTGLLAFSKQQQRFSHGELRKLNLMIAKLKCPELLVLDEPSQDLDKNGISWLRSWLQLWPNGLLIASHDPSILQNFRHFFVVAESGCRYFSGTFKQLEALLKKEHDLSEKRYVKRLQQLVKQEEHTLHITRRRGRKKRYGRVSELDRATPRHTLNQKRDYAQFKHGRMKKIRDKRIDAFRKWTKSTRSALAVELPLILPQHSLPKENSSDIVVLENISAAVENRCLFDNVSLRLKHQKVAVVGKNGSGKTTLLQIIMGERKASSGFVKRDEARIGYISQGAINWMLEESLLFRLTLQSSEVSPDGLSQFLIQHKFPLALAERPMYSLSPGERVRAALICLFYKKPTIELLVLDEPTCGLDILGQRSLIDSLNIWLGGLVVASHNDYFLEAILVDNYIDLDMAR